MEGPGRAEAMSLQRDCPWGGIRAPAPLRPSVKLLALPFPIYFLKTVFFPSWLRSLFIPTLGMTNGFILLGQPKGLAIGASDT